VRATDDHGVAGPRAYSVNRQRAAADVVISPDPLPTGSVGTAYEQLSARTGRRPLYLFNSDPLPNGITLDSQGELSGTPTEEAPSRLPSTSRIGIHSGVNTILR